VSKIDTSEWLCSKLALEENEEKNYPGRKITLGENGLRRRV
jgi:hypothetical protein